MGEVILIKKRLGKPYVAVSPRSSRSAVTPASVSPN